jgi:hypothetical protein
VKGIAMSEHITVIDVKVGVPGKYAVRVGPEVAPTLRLVNCYCEKTDTLIRTAGGSFFSNEQPTLYYDLDEAIQVAKSIQGKYFGYSVRVDCTIA